MHANIGQLLDIRDGLDSPLSEHVDNCEHCQAELAYLDSMATQLFEDHDEIPSEGSWARILEASDLQVDEVDSSEKVHYLAAANKHNGSLSRAIYTLAASVMFVGLVTLFVVSNQSNSARQQVDQMQANINQLMLNSQGLENVLQQVMVKNDRLTDEDRASAERLYWKLSYVDQELHDANLDAPEPSERIEILWSDRVEVLNELNRLFYQRKEVLVNAEY